MSVLYIDCAHSGLSGDMMVSALHDLGVGKEKFEEIAAAIQKHLEGTEQFSISFEKIHANGVPSTSLKTELSEQIHHRTVKTLRDGLNAICNEIKLSDNARQVADQILSIIINAEAKIHKVDSSQVHLHELASADTLFDAVGVAVGMETLDLLSANTQLFVSDVAVGGGTIKISHGTVSIPAPATSEILRSTSFVIKGGPIEKELLTPTGAAILASLKLSRSKMLPAMKVIKIGRGAGILAKEGIANPVTIYLGESPQEQEGVEEVVSLETNLDDIPGEYLGHALEMIMAEGALDAYISPIQMKKSRPANILHVLCKPEDQVRFLDLIFEETGTLGVRILPHNRMCIPREIQTMRMQVNGKEHEVRIKIARIHGRNISFKPEYEDLVLISKEENIPVTQLAKLAVAEFLKQFSQEVKK